MKTELSPEQIAHFREQGYVIIRGFLSADELEFWREAVEEAVAERAGKKLPDRMLVSHGDDEAYYEKVFVQRLQLWQTNEKIRSIMVNADLGKMVCDLTGEKGVRIWHDQALIKPAWGEPTAWHIDSPFWSFTSRNATSFWCALDDAYPQNGCMYYLPGTHLETEISDPGITSDIASIFEKYPQFRDREPVVVEMKAGDAVFHNASLVHGAGPNMTPYPRRAMTCAYMPEGSVFNGNQNIMNDEEFAAMKEGDLLNDDEKNPLIYPASN